jgi:ABC-2 type transport system ATP-binding protein
VNTGPSIEAEHLSRRFGDFLAVDDVSFHVEKGEIFGYLGANVAGTSTTNRMLIGLLAPTSGRATVAGHDVATDP